MSLITHNDWIKYFPFESPRQEQIDAINFALNAFVNGKKYVILSASTGIGKSAIGITISRFLRANYLSKNPNSVNVDDAIGTMILTTQKILQQQYLKDFGGNHANKLKSIKSSTSYTCQLHDQSEDKLTCGEIHRLMSANAFFKVLYEPCVAKCRYRLDKQIFLNALEGITNYSYFFAESKYAKGIQKRELLICDEAHNLEDNLSKFVEVVISERFASTQLDLKMPSFSNMNDAFQWIKTKYKIAAQQKLMHLTSIMDNMKDVSKKFKSAQEFAQKYDVLDKHICKINRFIETYSSDNWVFNIVPANGKSSTKLEFKPIDVSIFADDHLFMYGDKVLFLSATIFDKNVFCRSMGLNTQNVEFLRIASPFEIKNRIIHIMPIGSMSKNNIDTTLPMMRDAIKIILDEHKEEKGIIHTVNNRVSNYLIENIGNPRIVTHDSTNRELVLQAHENCTKPSVLISPSMMEGVDLSGDKSRFQIICKIPFPFLGDKVVQKRMKLHKDWYSSKTMISFIQAIGRSIRTMDDYAITYVLDSDWEIFYRSAKHLFPKDILLSIKS